MYWSTVCLQELLVADVFWVVDESDHGGWSFFFLYYDSRNDVTQNIQVVSC